jgi:hypothetical protein
VKRPVCRRLALQARGLTAWPRYVASWRRRREPQQPIDASTSTEQGAAQEHGGIFIYCQFGLADWQCGTFGIYGDCRCKVTENAMSQHLTRTRLSRSLIGALFAMIAFTAALFSAAHHFAG